MPKKSYAQRAPTMRQFLLNNSHKCKGKMNVSLYNNGKVNVKHTQCTKFDHIRLIRLSVPQKEFIIQKLNERILFPQIRNLFFDKFGTSISRHSINYLKNSLKIHMNYKTNKIDLVSSTNIRKKLINQAKIYSNLSIVNDIKKAIITFQFKSQQIILNQSKKILCIDSTHNITKLSIYIIFLK